MKVTPMQRTWIVLIFSIVALVASITVAIGTMRLSMAPPQAAHFAMVAFEPDDPIAKEPTGEQVISYSMLLWLMETDAHLLWRLEFDRSTPIPCDAIEGALSVIDALEPPGSRIWTKAHQIADPWLAGC